MKNNTKQLSISNRYLYSPNQIIYSNNYLNLFKTYDKVTKRDLLLQIQLNNQENPNGNDNLMDNLRQFKHSFILYIFDKIQIPEQNKTAYIFQGGVQQNLQNAMRKIMHLNQQDALVIFKYILLMVKQIHNKNLIIQRLCLQNILICNYALFKFGYNIQSQNLPRQYWSPERLNEKTNTIKSDIYSLGVMLYKMLYGNFPFKIQNQQENMEIIKKIKAKKFHITQNKSPLQVVISRQVHYLVISMLDLYQENRPDLDTILSNICFNFEIETDIQKYLKPKGSIVPQSFHKKYFVYRPSKMVIKHGQYYSQLSYLIFNIHEKTFMTMYMPQIRMFQTEPRKVQSYYEKLRAIMKNHKTESCENILKIDDIERFRQEPLITTNYCNQGNLFTYLQKRKIFKGWLTQSQTNIIMYLMAIALKQLKTIGISSIHTITNQRVMINNMNIKLREPGLLTPIIEKRLQQNKQIDFFAPELKQKLDFVQLDKTDIWSYGVLYIYLLTGQMPKNDEQNHINLQNLKTSRKNINIIGKCMDFNVKKRMELESIKMENINQQILHHMLVQLKEEQLKILKNKHQIKRQIYEDDQNQKEKQNNRNSKQQIDHSQLSSNAQELKQNKKVMFKHRKKRLFKHYNKIISQSTTSSCRLLIKTIFGLAILWFVFFGIFFVNGGIGLFRTNFYRKIKLQIPSNYGTTLYNMTILSTNGALIAQKYSDFSYQQFTIDLKCAENKYSPQAKYQLWNFVNDSQTVFCLFGFIWAILISILYVIQVYKLDLPTLMCKRKVNQINKNKQFYHLIISTIEITSLMFTFFYTFSFEYIIQMTPCLGLQNLAYPKFTSVQSILNGDLSTFFLNVFLTVVLWAILMLSFGFSSFFIKKVNNFIFQWIGIGIFASVMFIETLICRIGFGGNIPIQPTWSYKMNLDIIQTYFGLFGFFPELLWLTVIFGNALIDFIFWIFLKIGLTAPQEEDIKRITIVKAKFQRLETKQNLNDKNNIYLIENAYDFERFD